ncbi:hypothetical protein AB3S75_025117 [Citrus x aurantiifolia]
MGNCMQGCKNVQKEKEMVIEEIKQEEETSTRKEFVQESAFQKSSLKVKIVLTKQELQWLMLQLKDNEGKGLEALLGVIGRERNNNIKAGAWKPSLECIMECPEAREMDRS